MDFDCHKAQVCDLITGAELKVQASKEDRLIIRLIYMIDLVVWCVVPAMAHVILLNFAPVFAQAVTYNSKQLLEQSTGTGGQPGTIDY